MNKRTPDIRKILFWDIDYANLDWGKSAKFIIQRVFERGSMNEISELYKYYGKKKIIAELKSIDNFSERINDFILLYQNPTNN